MNIADSRRCFINYRFILSEKSLASEDKEEIQTKSVEIDSFSFAEILI